MSDSRNFRWTYPTPVNGNVNKAQGIFKDHLSRSFVLCMFELLCSLGVGQLCWDPLRPELVLQQLGPLHCGVADQEANLVVYNILENFKQKSVCLYVFSKFENEY